MNDDADEDEGILDDRGLVDVDLSRLEREWAGQAKRHRDLCDLAAKCKKEASYAKAQYDVTRAEVMLKVRKRPEKYGVDGKVGNDVAEAQVTKHPEVVAAQGKLIEAQYALDVAQAAVNASSHRKSALENAVNLWSMGYFAAPKERREATPPKKRKRQR